MKKAIILLVLALALTGCAKDANTDTNPSTQTDTTKAPTTEETTLPSDSNTPDAEKPAENTDAQLVTELKTALDSKDAELKALQEEINKLNKQLNDSKTTKTVASTAKPTSSNSSSSNKKLYYVITGSFSTTENAEKQKEKLVKAGHDSYVIKSGKYYRVVSGTFAEIDNAKAKTETLKKAGYDSFVLPSQGK